jgi:hypothetical protein
MDFSSFSSYSSVYTSTFFLLYHLTSKNLRFFFSIYKKQKSIRNVKKMFLFLFPLLLKKKYKRIQHIYSKYVQNNIIFNYLYTKSNTFISAIKSTKPLLLRSLGMLGFRKKKKKMQTHPNYLLGYDFINVFKKSYFRNYYKRLVVSIKGIRRFFRASLSNLRKYLGQIRKFFNTKTKEYKKFFNRKLRTIRMCQRKNRIYRMRFAQRKLETNRKRDRIKAISQLLRLSFVCYLGSVPFGGQNFGKKNLFERYIYKVTY